MKTASFAAQSGAAFQINGVAVNPAELTVGRDKDAVRVEPKVMALLSILATKSNVQVNREYLIDTIWQDGLGSDESLTRLVYQLRRAFKSFPKLENTIKTVSKSGYKLEAPVEGQIETPQPRRRGTDNIQMDRREYNLSIAVIPVTDYDDIPENRYLVDGMARDLTGLLAKTPMLSVTPHSSVIALHDQTLSIENLAETIGCRFILTGSFRRQAEQIRLRFELVDTQDSSLAWSGKYNTVLDQFFEVQHDVLLNVSTAISTNVQFPLVTADRTARPFKNEVYRIIQTTETLRYRYGKDTAQEIVRLLTEGLEIDPGNAVLQAGLAVQLSQNTVSQWEEYPNAARISAFQNIELALATAPTNAEILGAAGIVHAMFHQPKDAIGYLRRAVELDPNNAHATAVLGWQICLANDDADGLNFIEAAESRAPHHPRFGLWATYRATAHLFMLDYGSAVPACEQAILRTPQYYQPRLSLAWALLGAGDHDSAKKATEEAEKFEGAEITAKFVCEMKKWSANSPHAEQCNQVLDELLLMSS
ncbi:MAG: winged helix-turn-helix domain-containing protein [Parasphingorhabdus sp.]|uniref:winged helix-turn-helix domain-containing protein n=4 Tax=Parasphingorhabdus sp. TaxID=2709688 RepID=UPI0032968C30